MLHWLYLQVVWGRISMVDAERRLLANALKDPDNQHFVLLSDRWPDYQVSLSSVSISWTGPLLISVYESPFLHGIAVAYHCMILTMSTTIWCIPIWASLTGSAIWHDIIQVFICFLVYAFYFILLIDSKFCLPGWWTIQPNVGFVY